MVKAILLTLGIAVSGEKVTFFEVLGDFDTSEFGDRGFFFEDPEFSIVFLLEDEELKKSMMTPC